MERNLKVRRIFNLGDYNNIEFTEEIVDIPEKFVLNKEVMQKLRRLLMLNIESTYAEYLKINKMSDDSKLELETINGKSLEQAFDLDKLE